MMSSAEAVEVRADAGSKSRTLSMTAATLVAGS
jgi:hypothetical protein